MKTHPAHPTGHKKQNNENRKNWEGNVVENLVKYKDMDINQAHPSETSKLNQQKIKIDDFNQNVIKKSMIRYLTIIVDFTKASIKQDYRPNKATVVKENVENFL